MRGWHDDDECKHIIYECVEGLRGREEEKGKRGEGRRYREREGGREGKRGREEGGREGERNEKPDGCNVIPIY